MPRLLLALVLLLCLQPAAAQEVQSPSAQNGIAALTSPPAAIAAPAGWRLELLQRQPPSGVRDSPIPRLPALAGARAISTDAETLRRSAAATVGRRGARLPHLEHLPYYATAPPARR